MRIALTLAALAGIALAPLAVAALPPSCSSNCILGATPAWIPTVLSVPIGAVVTFEAVDVPIHPAELDGQKLLGTRTGALTRYEATTAGDWEYRCQLHPWMVGRITVT